MNSADLDLAYLEAGQEALQRYLLAEELYWPIGISAPPGSPPYPQLTLEGMLLCRARCGACQLVFQQSTRFNRVVHQMDVTRSEWRSAWRRKAGRALHTRLTQWANFLQDYREHPEANVDRFAYEIRLRVMIELLKAELEQVQPADADALQGLDGLLRGRLLPGSFIWEAELQPGFPADRYWFLYGALTI